MMNIPLKRYWNLLVAYLRPQWPSVAGLALLLSVTIALQLLNPQILKNAEAMIPLGRGGTPEEAAGAVYLFCIPESNYVSGQVLVCGGGRP